MASDQFQPESNRIAASEWNKPKVRNGLFFNPTPLLKIGSEQELSGESIKLSTHGSESHQLSLIMPPPAQVRKKSGQLSKPKLAPVTKHALAEYIPKHALEIKIDPSQTRFPNKIVPLPNRSLAAPTETSESETDGSTTDASTDLDAPLRPIGQERRHHQRKHERIQQSYVAMTPLLVPGAGNQSPITTWGTVDTTPLVLSGQEHKDTNSSSFTLSGETERDRAARKAEVQLARRAKRAKSTKSKSTKLKALTPAATSLLEKVKRTPSRPRDAFASALRSSYTPNPRSKSTSRSSRRTSDSAYNATPLASQHQRASEK
jgi:hypothetical protein